MFFLKELPTRLMIEGYAAKHASLDADAVEDALGLMRRASLMVRRLEAYFAEHGLSQLRFLVLIVIDREPHRDGLSVGEITDRLDVSKPVMTRTVAHLVESGLIAVEADPNDARGKVVRLTPAGRAKLAEVLPEYFVLLSALGRREPDTGEEA
ncbi:MarR family winged helix-turn-helix transcriptional regulator [Parvularcula maris]|uniref:MarR family transcriptional regulator n=1 Tax=Parvularcula maris TaxID=2965077 RepID=A0A9X2LAW8_9PROT|nr:MarR family transcriptional regulator [Parvularcula maris]MCQ8186133.1 MarR family transcriptional regulator [Parvularcula maris]